MEHFGFPTHTYEQVRANVGSGVRSLINKSLPENVAKEGEEFEGILSYFQSRYEITHDDIEGCYDGLYEVVMKLYNSGYKMAVLSNKPDPFVKNIIKKLFPEGVMSFALGQTEMPRKPDPTVPVMIATSLGIELADTYFIGDSEVDILTAKNSGMHSVAVSWGFRDKEELIKSCPEVIVDSPKELWNYFEE
jgi:phosphoglycolate phosphatase